jgi:CubicO group peptidase (beta-lactamase class C family)
VVCTVHLFRLELLSALTILDVAAEGIVDLDEAVDPPGATLRHLLAHASGLASEGNRVLAAPVQRRIYSNSGIEKAAERVERRPGRRFRLLLTERVLDRLGMSRTVLRGSPAHGAAGPVSDLARLAHELLAPGALDPTLDELFQAGLGVL